MALYRHNGGLGQIRQELDRIFNDLTQALPLTTSFGSARGYPAVNVWESDHALHVEAELAGVKQDQVEILVVGNELTLKGNRQQPPLTDSVYHRRERSAGAFSRTIRLPVDVDAGKVEASLSNGVLEITLPKAEAAKPRKIQVNVR